jgi:amidohydrolase
MRLNINRHPVLAAVVSMLLASAPTQAQHTPTPVSFDATKIDAKLDARLLAEIAAVQPRVVSWRRDIHQHPELSEQEVRTAGLVAAHLRSLGMEVRTGIAETGVIGILKGGKPGGVIALRADMDALPIEEQTGLPFASRVTANYGGKKTAVMHACGHDAHVAILLGAATALTKIRSEIPGTILFVFQPAEEGTPGDKVSGAELMMQQKAFAGIMPDAMIGLHVQPGEPGQLFWRPGAYTAASDRIEIQLTGRQTHGARPWDGVDMSSMAADIVHAFNRIAARQVDVTKAPTVLTIAAINGGNRYNIIPENMTLLGTLRTFDPDIRKTARTNAELALQSITQSYGARGKLIWTAPTSSIVNEPALTAALTPTLRQISGGKTVEDAPYITGSDDFSYFGKEMPTLYVFMGIGFPKGTNHSPLFDVVDEASMEVGVRAQAFSALHFLQQRVSAK